MTPEVGQVNQNIAANSRTISPAVVVDFQIPAPPADWEVRLAESAASQLSGSLAKCSPTALVAELLRDLAQEQRSRISQNLNHWPEYAPQFLAREVARRLAAEQRRQDEAVAFIEARGQEALTFARTFFARPEDAEDAVAEADIKLWRGETVPKFYFRKLRQIILDKLKRRTKERELFEVTRSFDGPKIRKTDDLWECLNDLKHEEDEIRGAPAMDDPLTTLLWKGAVDDAIQKVKTDRRRRGVRSRGWWKDLMESRELSRK